MAHIYSWFFFTVVCCTPKRQALPSQAENQEQEAIKSEPCSRRRQERRGSDREQGGERGSVQSSINIQTAN